MASLISFAFLLSLSGLTTAAPAGRSLSCKNLTIPVDIESHQPLFNSPPFDSNLDGTLFTQNFTSPGRVLPAELLAGNQTLKGRYNISATFCHPSTGISNGPIQVLTHGIGFDKSYWDIPYKSYEYSYVQTAVGKFGYNTLAIDRLGTGASSTGDPVNVIQTFSEVEALAQVTLQLRKGNIRGVDRAFKKVVHVGHSMGSDQTYWLSSFYPNITDGVVLTGWSPNGLKFAPLFLASLDLRPARFNQPFRFGNHKAKQGDIVPKLKAALKTPSLGSFNDKEIANVFSNTEVANFLVGLDKDTPPADLPGDYLTWASLTNNEYTFLKQPFFDQNLAIYSELTKQPVTAGELLTVPNAPPSSSFSGPVLFFAGEFDLPFCGGNCRTSGLETAAKGVYPKASKFDVKFQPNTANGVNLHYNATAGYEVVNTWLGQSGLGAK